YTAGTMLSELYTTVSRVDCNGVNGDTITTLARTILSNKRYKNDATYNQFHHKLMARILRDEGMHDQAIQHLEQAISYKPSADLNMMVVTTYADKQDFDAARDFIESARQSRPRHPLKRFAWSNGLDELLRYIDVLALRTSKAN